MINFEVLNNALGKVSPSEFTVLYYIANNLSLKNASRTRIYKQQIADKLNYSTKQVGRLTDALAEKGFIKKDEITDSRVSRSVNYYSLVTDTNEDMDVQERTPKVDKNVPLKKNIKDNKKKNNNINKNKSDSEGQGTECSNSFTDFLDNLKLKSDCEREADESL